MEVEFSREEKWLEPNRPHHPRAPCLVTAPSLYWSVLWGRWFPSVSSQSRDWADLALKVQGWRIGKEQREGHASP